MFRISVAILGLVLMSSFTLEAKGLQRPDKAYMQRILDGWADASKRDGQAKYYASGESVFFDIAPLKYDSFDEYLKGAKAMLLPFQNVSMPLNDDLKIHVVGNTLWGTATAEFSATKDGKSVKNQIRWTFIMEKKKGNWLIVHEHVSFPSP